MAENNKNLFVRADTTNNGRYANQFIRAMAAHFIAENLEAQPFYPPINLARLGIQLYKPSTPNILLGDTQIVNLEETNFMDFMTTNKAPTQNSEQISAPKSEVKISKILYLNHIYCQTPELAIKIKNFLWKPDNTTTIKSANPYKARYDANNDVFIHVRLGDVPFHNPGFAYYDQVLSGIKFTAGYITSDTINHPICLALIRKYRLQIINPQAQIEDILQLGSTCKHIILSAGTFSWLIGILGFYSQVYYPDPEQKRRWHGCIFECVPEWVKITY
jgi:hypothetical protein